MGWWQILIFFTLLILLAIPLGYYMAAVYRGQRTWITPVVQPLERQLYRLGRIETESGQSWQQYAISMLVFNALGLAILYLLLRLQSFFPLNPAELGLLEPSLAFNTAVSFASNTNWQFYGGETTMSYLSQMAGLTIQNFVSAATGMALLVAIARGFGGAKTQTVGNFWVDLTRSVLYVLLPLSLILATFLVSQGVVQTLAPYQEIRLLQPVTGEAGADATHQLIAVGPAASQIAIKQLGTNGGGFFNVNSAHPLENPTPLSNLIEMLAILLIPVRVCFTFGAMVADKRQGWAIFGTMLVVFVLMLGVVVWSEQQGNPLWNSLPIDQTASATQSGGNMEGKEVRFGIVNSAIWATATTAASNGSVNSMHDFYTPLGGLPLLVLMQLGEVIYGGVGSGLYGFLAYVIVAVFVAGLLVGRTPEYLGKKIESFEMKMAALALLLPIATVLVLTGIAVVSDYGLAAIQDGGPHGLSEILYAYTSQGNNNGSAFAGIGSDATFHYTGGLAMLIGRYWVALPMLALAGALGQKPRLQTVAGTLPTHTPLFVGWLVLVILITGALSFLPALALGPVIEHLLLLEYTVF